MLHNVLIVRMQYPVGQVANILSQAFTVLLDGVGILPAITVPLQDFLIMFPLLLLNNFAGLLQHLLQNLLILNGEDFRFCLFDLTVQDLHPVTGLLGGCSVHLGTKLLFLIEASLFCSFLLQGLQLRQALLENIQGVSLCSRNILVLELAGSQFQHFTIRQRIGALLVLLHIAVKIFSTLFLHGIFFHAVKCLFFFGVQDLHDLIISGTLLIQLCLLSKRLIDQFLLFRHILPGLCKGVFPLLHGLIHALHLCDQMIDHEGSIAGIGIERICLGAGDQALNAFMGLYNPQFKARKLTDGGVAFLAGLGSSLCHQCDTGVLLISKFLLAHSDGELALREGVHSGSNILFTVSNTLLQGFNGTSVCFQLLLSLDNSATVCPVQAFQLLNVGVQLHLLHDQRATGSKRLDLCCGERYFTGVLGLTAHILAIHYLVDKVLLSFQNVPQSCIEAAFGNIGEVLHFIIDIALAVSSAVSLLHITRSPRCIQMVNSHDTLLRIHADAHFTGGADQHSHLAVVHISKQFLFLGISVRFMDKGNFLSRNTALHQPGLDVIIELCALHIGLDFFCFSGSSIALALRRCHIAEDNLRTLDLLAFLVLSQDIISAAVDLAAFLIRQARIDHTLGVGDFSAVTGDLQHVIHTGINILDIVGSFFQFLHEVLLELARFTHHDIYFAALHLRDFQTRNIGQHIRKVPEKQLQLAHVLKPGEALFHTIALAAGLNLHTVDHFTELLCPGIESRKPQLIQQIRLQILLHDVHLAHGVHNRRSGSKYDATAAVQLLQIANLGVKVKRSLGAVLVAQTRNIGHGGGVEQILEVVGLVHEDAVHAQLLKVDVSFVLGAVGQLLDLGLQRFALLFQVLNGKALTTLLSLSFFNGPDHALDLLLVQFPCKVIGNRQSLELLIAYDHGVIIAVCNAVHENLSVGCSKVAGFCHQQLCSREKVHKLIAPLCNQGFRHRKHRLLYQAQLLQLHCCRCHLVGLTCAHFVSQQGVTTGGDNTLHSIALVGSQRLHRIGAVDSQVITVVLRSDNRVKHFIVQRCQLGPACLVLPQPLLEFLLDILDLLIRCCGSVSVYHALAVCVLILDHNALAVQHSIKQIQEGPAIGAPFLGVVRVGFQIFLLQLNGKVAGIFIPGHFHRLAPFAVAAAQHVCCEVRVYGARNPRCTRIYENILIAHIFRHNCLQGIHILLVVLIQAYQGLSVTEFCTNITRQVNFCSFQLAVPVLECLAAVDQLSGDGFHGFSGQLGDQCRIYAAGLINRNDQAFGYILCRGNGSVRRNGILRENIRFGCLLGLRVPVFQRKDGVSVRITHDSIFVGLGIDKSVLLNKVIIELVQLLSGLFDLGFFQPLLLCVLKCLGSITDFQHTTDTLNGTLCHILLDQLTILVLINLAVLHNQAIFLGLLTGSLHSEVGSFRARLRRIVHFTLDVLEGLTDLIGKRALVLKCLIGQITAAVSSAIHGSCAKHHFRMAFKIAVDIRTIIATDVLIGSFQEVLTGIVSVCSSLFQHQDVCHDFGTGIALESIVRQSDGAQQVSMLHNVAAHRAVVAVHGIAGCDKHHNTAGSHLVQRFGEEIIVNSAGDLLRIILVSNGVVTERNIADCYIHEVIRDIGLLEALDAYICIGVQILGHHAGNAVQLHHGPAAHIGSHIRRHSTNEVTDTGARLHHSAAGKAQLLQTIIHSLDHRNIGVMGIQRRASCAGIFFIGQQFLQLLELLGPVCFPLIKGICQAAPANILGKNGLLCFSSISPLSFQFLHQANGFHIGLVPGLFATRQVQAIPDHEVAALGLLGRLLGNLLHNFFL